MIDDMFKVLGEHAAEILFEIITESMDDYLYIFDLQDNTMEISQSATDRFMISQCIMNDALTAVMKVVYEDDRRMLEKHLADIREGKEKVHNLHYRWLDKNGLPIWVACRGKLAEYRIEWEEYKSIIDSIMGGNKDDKR